jgi:hypothetical protein
MIMATFTSSAPIATLACALALSPAAASAQARSNTPPVKAPAHPAARSAAPALPDNPAATGLLTVAQIVAKIPTGPLSQGTLSGSRLITFGAFDPEFRSGSPSDSTIGHGRQIWELTYVFPNGVTMSRAQLGSDAKAIVAYDAATGAYLASKWTGGLVRRIGGKR